MTSAWVKYDSFTHDPNQQLDLESPPDRISSGLYGVPYTDPAPDGEWEDDSPYSQAVDCSASQYTSVTSVVTSGDRKTFPGTPES